MMKELLTSILQLIIILPLILIFIKEKKKENYYRILAFAICFLTYQIALELPRQYQKLDFINGNWNWAGKVFGVTVGVLCYFLFKRGFAEHNYFTLRQNKKTLKSTAVASVSIVILATVIWYVLGESEFDLETLLFQLTLPGLDEEIMYRGILLGLLMTTLSDKISVGKISLGNPSVLITAVLFGLVHALGFLENWQIRFDMMYFIRTGIAGYIWAWIVIKSRSILFPILSHNLSNFFGTLATMIK